MTVPLRRPRPASLLLIFALVAVVGITALATLGWWLIHRTPHRPNVLIITIDTLRADHVGSYGFARAHTPILDRLAAEGVRCTDAIAAAPITLPSHASLLTGLYPPAHGLHDNGTGALPHDVTTLADRLTQAGYTTHAFVSAVVLSRLYGLDKGFATYDDDLYAEDAPRLFMIRERPAKRTADRALEWFDTWRKDAHHEPFFTWVHFFDPHQPHDPSPEDLKGAASAYDAEITAADRGAGRIIDALRQANVLDDTIVVATADHGESLGEHGEATHAVFVYDATVRVPLIVRFPAAFPAGRVYEGPTRHIDVTPTILGLLHLPGGNETQGVDLTEAWAGRTEGPILSQYSESRLSELGFGMAPLFALRKSNLKYIRAPRPELYDLATDPHELTNTYKVGDAHARALDEELEGILKAAKPHPQQDSPIGRETVEMLQSLGYLAPSTVRQSMGGIDPKDGIVIYNQLEEARHEAQRRRWPATEAIVRKILGTLPDHVAARNVLALSLVRQHRYAEAREAYTQSLKSDPNQFRIHGNLGSLALLDHQLDEADREFTRALDLNPRFVEAMLNRGLIASLRGDQAGAEWWYRRAEGIDPNVPMTARRLGDLYFEMGQYRQALTNYDRALQLAPRMFPALVQAGSSARRLGDVSRAAASFERAAAIRPDSWIPWYNLACLRATTGDVEGAMQALRESTRRGIDDPSLLESDPDLDRLRADARFTALARESEAHSAGGRAAPE